MSPWFLLISRILATAAVLFVATVFLQHIWTKQLDLMAPLRAIVTNLLPEKDRLPDHRIEISLTPPKLVDGKWWVSDVTLVNKMGAPVYNLTAIAITGYEPYGAMTYIEIDLGGRGKIYSAFEPFWDETLDGQSRLMKYAWPKNARFLDAMIGIVFETDIKGSASIQGLFAATAIRNGLTDFGSFKPLSHHQRKDRQPYFDAYDMSAEHWQRQLGQTGMRENRTKQ